MGWPIILKNAARLKARLPAPQQPLAQFPLSEPSVRNGNAVFRAESVGFDLATHFLHTIVVSVDFMTFQTRNMWDAAEKPAGAAFSGAFDSLCILPFVTGIDWCPFLLKRWSCN